MAFFRSLVLPSHPFIFTSFTSFVSSSSSFFLLINIYLMALLSFYLFSCFYFLYFSHSFFLSFFFFFSSSFYYFLFLLSPFLFSFSFPLLPPPLHFPFSPSHPFLPVISVIPPSYLSSPSYLLPLLPVSPLPRSSLSCLFFTSRFPSSTLLISFPCFTVLFPLSLPFLPFLPNFSPFTLAFLLLPFPSPQVTWLKREDDQLLTVGQQVYVAEKRFSAVHSDHTEVSKRLEHLLFCSVVLFECSDV